MLKFWTSIVEDVKQTSVKERSDYEFRQSKMNDTVFILAIDITEKYMFTLPYMQEKNKREQWQGFLDDARETTAVWAYFTDTQVEQLL